MGAFAVLLLRNCGYACNENGREENVVSPVFDDDAVLFARTSGFLFPSKDFFTSVPTSRFSRSVWGLSFSVPSRYFVRP